MLQLGLNLRSLALRLFLMFSLIIFPSWSCIHQICSRVFGTQRCLLGKCLWLSSFLTLFCFLDFNPGSQSGGPPKGCGFSWPLWAITAPWALTPKHTYTKTRTHTLGPPAAMVLWWDPAFLVRDDGAGVDTRPTPDHSAPLSRGLKLRNSVHGKESWVMRMTGLQLGSPQTGVWESPPFLLPPDLCVVWPLLWFQRLLPQCLQVNPTLYFS